MVPTVDVTCPGCDAHWAGQLTGHCTACHATFSDVAAFDTHRSGSYAKGRVCLPPRDVGLTLADRPYPCWEIEGE